MPSNFSTIHYSRFQMDRAKSALKTFQTSLPPKAAMFAVFEQKASRFLEMGEKPHLHIVTAGISPSLHRKIIARLFHFTRDILTQTLDKYRTADIVLRYLQGKKKNQSAAQRKITEEWRRMRKLPAFVEVNHLRKKAREQIGQDVMRQIEERGESYD